MKSLKFIKGQEMLFEGKEVYFQEAIDLQKVVVIDKSTKDRLVAKIIDLKIKAGVQKIVSAEAFSETQIQDAERKSKIVEAFIKKIKRGQSAHKLTAKTSGSGISTLYKWRKAYRENGVDGLVSKTRGVKRGSKRLDPEIEEVLQLVIDTKHLSKERAGPVDLLREAKIVLAKRGSSKKPPHINTIRNRLNMIPERVRAEVQMSPKAFDEWYTENAGKLVAHYPLEIVQVDHTMLKVIVVSDDEYRLPLGPAWITVVFDIYSRMVLGLYITLEHPSALSVGEAVAHAVLPKEAWLKARDVDVEWPVWGVPGTIHADNGSDFRSETISKSCSLHKINITWRPVGRPNWGGHIEAYMKALYEMFKRVPGAVYKDSKERPDYDSSAEALMTLNELETYLVREIVGKYHQERHSGIDGATPIAKWKKGLFQPETGLGMGIPERIVDEENFRLDFKPRYERTIGPSGVQIGNVNYWERFMTEFINQRDPLHPKLKRKFVFRGDHRNIKFVHFWDPKREVYERVSTADLTIPNASRWEWNKAVKKVRDELGNVDEQRVVKTLLENRELLEKSRTKSKKARRELERIKRNDSATRSKTPEPNASGAATTNPDEPIDITPFDDVS